MFLKAILIVSTFTALMVCQNNPHLDLELEKTFLHKKDNLPLYLALTANTDEAREPVNRFSAFALKLLHEKFPEDEILKSNLEDIASYQLEQFKEPGSWHITVLYIGGNRSKTETQFYKNFKQGKHIPIVSKTFLYVPNKIMAAAVFPNREEILIENNCPHVTLYLGEWSAVDSNRVLENLFINGGPLEAEYQAHKFAKKDFFYIQKFEKRIIKNEEVDVYIVSFDEPAVTLELDGVESKMNS